MKQTSLSSSILSPACKSTHKKESGAQEHEWKHKKRNEVITLSMSLHGYRKDTQEKLIVFRPPHDNVFFWNYWEKKGENSSPLHGSVTSLSFPFVLSFSVVGIIIFFCSYVTFVLFKYFLLYKNVRLKRFCFVSRPPRLFFSQMNLNQKCLMILERKRKTVLRRAWKIQYASP